MRHGKPVRRADRGRAAVLFPCIAVSLLTSAPAGASERLDLRNFDALTAAATANMIANPAGALNLALQAERDLREEKILTAVRLARAYWLQADAAERLGQTDKSRRLVEQALEVLGDMPDPKLRGDLLLTRGAANTAEGKVSAALADFQTSYRYFVQAEDRRGQAIALAHLASLYREGGDFAGARRYYLQALEAQPPASVSFAIYNGLGNVLTEMNRFPQASAAFEQALRYSPQEGAAVRARILANLARAQLNDGKVAAATRTVAEGVRLVTRADAAEVLPQIYSVAARVEMERGNLARARSLIERSFDGVAPSQTTLAMRDNHLVAAQIYRESGDADRAVEHLVALRRLDEQALEIATSAKAALMGARFDFQNQELRIARLKAEELRRNVAFEQSRTRFQQILFGGIGGTVAIVAILLAFGLVTIRRSRNQVRAANLDLGVANDSLEKALAAKTEFLATTSHEIRTPLNGILGMTQVMLADGRLAPATRERVEIVHAAGMRMRGMVDDILDVAKMENGNFTIDITTVDLPAVLHDATRLWEEQAEGRGIAFALECRDVPRWIESDPSRLRQIVFNLLSNALKFTHAGSLGVRVTATGTASAARLQIAVWDTGIGIPADKHGQIFESFRQVDAGTTRHYGGTGLGLTICRNLAVALGGDIRVESVEGQGSTFTVDLPLVEAAAPAVSRAEAGSAAGLLILDRNPIVRSMMKTLFAPHVPELHFATTVEDALAHLRRGQIAQLLIDEGSLPQEDSVQARVAPLTAAARTAGVRVAVLWPALDAADSAALRAAGVDQPIAKPISGASLVNTLFVTNYGPERKSPLVSHAA